MIEDIDWELLGQYENKVNKFALSEKQKLRHPVYSAIDIIDYDLYTRLGNLHYPITKSKNDKLLNN